MSRIKIQDLPQDQTISKDELKRIRGGISLSPTYTLNSYVKIESPSDSFLKMNAETLYNTAGKF